MAVEKQALAILYCVRHVSSSRGTVALLRADNATRGCGSQYQGLGKTICISKKVARNLATFQFSSLSTVR